MASAMRWTFVLDPAGGWSARRRPATDANLVVAAELFADEVGTLERLGRFTEAWVAGAATDPNFSAGCEAVVFTLVDSVVVRTEARYGHFEAAELSLTDFRAMLDGLHRAVRGNAEG
ncbi:hypothetical protein [Plantactinospora sp. B5E13]|uniref:hypothetical protein n=1 Tax=unclassified Plantactinospora TaxID=2631981 RepID=UPI00325F4154